MENKYEKILMSIVSGWQILNGLITAFIYSNYIRNNTLSTNAFNDLEISSFMANNFLMISVSIGVVFILLGVINILILKKQIKLNSKTIFKYLLFQLILSMLLMDFITVSLLLVLLVLYKARSKAINQNTKGEIYG